MFFFFSMSGSNPKVLRKDFVCKYTIEVFEEKYIKYKFCHKKYKGEINRFKYHLVGTHHK